MNSFQVAVEAFFREVGSVAKVTKNVLLASVDLLVSLQLWSACKLFVAFGAREGKTGVGAAFVLEGKKIFQNSKNLGKKSEIFQK